MVKVLVLCNVLCWPWGFCKFRFLSFFRSLFACFSLFTLYIFPTSFLVERYFNLFLMELILPFTACKARNRFYKFEMKFQSFCSTRSSSLCACFGASSSSNFGAMKLGIIGVTTSLSSSKPRIIVRAPTPLWHKVTIETNFKTIKLVRFMF